MLEREIALRVKDREVIRDRVRSYVFRKFGIEDLFALANETLGEVNGFEVCLSRQITTANTEHAAVSAFSNWLTSNMNVEVAGRFLSFTRDAYMPNPYKRSLVRLPQLKRGRKGPFLNYQKIANPCEGEILSLISTQKNLSLPSFHENLREGIIAKEKVSDLSDFFQNLAKSAKKNGPPSVYLRRGGKEEKSFRFDVRDDLRPPAEWYYLPYLLLFMDGSRGLLCTINQKSGVYKHFTNSLSEIKKEIGFLPLLIPVPKEIIWEVNGHFEPRGENIFSEAIFKSGWQSEINIPSSLNLHEAFESIEHQILHLA